MGGTETGRSAPRSDIQGLRTIAVLSVLVYHVTPRHLTGGFVGVDIFFVISGFLITAHLLARPPAGVKDFVGFWGRRVRRLLPASLLVLVVTLVATRLWGPETLWDNTARQAGAASLYFVNWLLASDAVDYLAAENVATPVQHYWSLSVEEQFYLVWPLLIGLLVWVSVRSGVRRSWVLAAGLGAVVVASLVWSIHLTATEPGAAYFVTPTRMWELAVGGVVALLVPVGAVAVSARVRAGVAWVGVVLMGWAMVTFDAGTAFPSWTAAVPVGGAALVLAAGCGTQWWSPGRLLALRPVQWVGDISYSVYLWHWPLVVLVGARVGGLDWFWGSVVVCASLVLAALTKRYVEDPFRTASWNRRLGATYAWGVAGMVVVLVASGALHWNVDRRAAAAERDMARILKKMPPCLGAGSLDPALDCDPWQGPIVPSPAKAIKDVPPVYYTVGGRNCFAALPSFKQVTCGFGPKKRKAAASVALLGNSHVGHWVPALLRVAKPRKWHLTTYMANSCPSVGIPLTWDTKDESSACTAWTEKAVDSILEAKPDLVVMSNANYRSAEGVTGDASLAAYAAGYESVLRKFAAAGIRVLAIRDNPAPSVAGLPSVPDCVASHGADGSECQAPRSDWEWPDPTQDAVEALNSPLISFADLNDRICDGDTCRSVQGGVIVFSDAHHLTATYSKTLAPALRKAVDGALSRM